MSNTNKTDKQAAIDDAWDTGALGRDEQYVRRASAETDANIDDAIAMQLISIRLHKKTIDDLKFIAKANDMGYQPLIRDVLERFIEGAVKEIIRETQARQARNAIAAAEEVTKPKKAA